MPLGKGTYSKNYKNKVVQFYQAHGWHETILEYSEVRSTTLRKWIEEAGLRVPKSKQTKFLMNHQLYLYKIDIEHNHSKTSFQLQVLMLKKFDKLFSHTTISNNRPKKN